MGTRGPRLPVVALRWTIGVALVSWRYLWATLPMYRSEERGSLDCCSPPPLPTDLSSDVLRPEEGSGPLFHRRFSLDIAQSQATAEELMGQLVRKFGDFVPHEVVGVKQGPGPDRELEPGEEFVVQIPGPWNGPVVVLERTPCRLRLATRPGHMEAGQIEFSATGREGRLTFSIETWARASTQSVHVLFSHLRLAKEIQLNMWVRFCRAAARRSGGRIVDGVHIITHVSSD
jgi:hypothetical protein